MIDVERVLGLHETTVVQWHSHPIENNYEGVWNLICQQHIYNFELWHQEDIARSREVSAERIAEVKRAIDRFNQLRNDHIEKLDDWITASIRDLGVVPSLSAKLNTETPGSVIDRLSIMSLRLFHYREQLERTDIDLSQRTLVQNRTALCEDQRRDLSQSLSELLTDIFSGRKLHKTYRQMKMYNDPRLNPYLYRESAKVAA